MALSRRSFINSAGVAGAAALTGAPVPSLARATPMSTQVPGLVRRKVGTIEVTALLDGYLEMAPDLFIGSNPEEAAKLAAGAFRKPGVQHSPVNAYLVNLGNRLVLIDTGAAATFGPALGKLPAVLTAAGVTPEQIDAVLLTHMHPDHIDGALKPDGTALFPNAELVVTNTDYAYWHDDANLNRAPEAVKPFFLGARRAAAAYANRTRKIQGESEAFGSVRTVPLPGHTPGHAGYIIDSNGETLFIWADAIHLATYQFARPDWSAAFDIDPVMASATRKRVLDRAATDRVMVAGMHLPFPGFGHVARDGKEYRYIPAEWPYTL